MARMARIGVRSSSLKRSVGSRISLNQAPWANARELARTVAPNRQAGGHWFEPSTAHKSPANSQDWFAVETNDSAAVLPARPLRRTRGRHVPSDYAGDPSDRSGQVTSLRRSAATLSVARAPQARSRWSASMPSPKATPPASIRDVISAGSSSISASVSSALVWTLGQASRTKKGERVFGRRRRVEVRVPFVADRAAPPCLPGSGGDDQPRGGLVFVLGADVMAGESPILLVVHDQDDDWQFLSGSVYEPERGVPRSSLPHRRGPP